MLLTYTSQNVMLADAEDWEIFIIVWPSDNWQLSCKSPPSIALLTMVKTWMRTKAVSRRQLKPLFSDILVWDITAKWSLLLLLTKGCSILLLFIMRLSEGLQGTHLGTDVVAWAICCISVYMDNSDIPLCILVLIDWDFTLGVGMTCIQSNGLFPCAFKFCWARTSKSSGQAPFTYRLACMLMLVNKGLPQFCSNVKQIDFLLSMTYDECWPAPWSKDSSKHVYIAPNSMDEQLIIFA